MATKKSPRSQSRKSKKSTTAAPKQRVGKAKATQRARAAKRSQKKKQEAAPAPLKRRVFPALLCDACGKKVPSPQEAVVYDGNALHFACVRARLVEQYELAEGEDIIYIGQGNFARVRFTDSKRTSFTSIERIPIESEADRYEFVRFLEYNEDPPWEIDFYADSVRLEHSMIGRDDNLDIRDLMLGSDLYTLEYTDGLDAIEVIDAIDRKEVPRGKEGTLRR